MLPKLLRPLKTCDDRVFPRDHQRRTIDREFHRIQSAADIHLKCHIDREHKCTASCHTYGFHDERRAFATFNALNMSEQALQALMRFQSPLTTKRYVNVAQQLNPAVAKLYVPDVG